MVERDGHWWVGPIEGELLPVVRFKHLDLILVHEVAGVVAMHGQKGVELAVGGPDPAIAPACPICAKARQTGSDILLREIVG